MASEGVVTMIEKLPEQNVKKRSRNQMTLSPSGDDGEMNREVDDDGGASEPGEIQMITDESGQETRQSTKPDLQRFLDAKRKRRRLGTRFSDQQLQTDIADAREFLALSDVDKQAYLSVYEYDNSNHSVVEGLTKVSTVGLKVALAFTTPVVHYPLAMAALNSAEVQDTLGSMIECSDNLSLFSDSKYIKLLASIGHSADTVATLFMNTMGMVSRAASLASEKPVERATARSVHSLFDLDGGETQSQNPNGKTVLLPPSTGSENQTVAII